MGGRRPGWNNINLKYVGDGKVWFEGKNHFFNPDFISEKNKQIIEIFGEYWHSSEEDKKIDEERIKTYRKNQKV